MSLKIDQDHARFKRIVRGNVRKNLRRYVSSGDILIKRGKGTASIPVPNIEIPRFRFGNNEGGVGQGKGEEGDPVGGEPGKGDGQGSGQGKAGQDEGQHALEVEVSFDELAEILGEELELPKIEPKGNASVVDKKDRYVGIRQVGPNSLRHFKRTYKSALKRQISMGQYNPAKPVVIPTKDDMRYRSWKTDEEPVANAAIIYMMDVSGSMGDEQKEIVRLESFWLDAWLNRHYKGVETRFIIHDAAAKEVDRDTFFSTKESGGTMISSAYSLCADTIDADYPASDWNVYPFHFSDGDNWSADDTKKCLEILEGRILPQVNVFSYGQVESTYGSGQFIKDLRGAFEDDDRVTLSEIADRDAILDSLKDFLSKGK